MIGLALTTDGHAACPGHAAYLDRQYGQIDPVSISAVDISRAVLCLSGPHAFHAVSY